MPPKKSDVTAASSGEDGAIALTPGDVKMIDVVLKNSGPASKPNGANWTKIVEQLELKDAKSAKERFRQVCKKYQWFESEEASPGAAAAPPSKKRAAPRRTAKDAEGADDADDVEGPPAKKRKANGTPVKKARKVEAAEFGVSVENDGADNKVEGFDDGLDLMSDEI
ncbi:hypothetical protein AAE478_008350 [Parahypoxylon ruwenzoriense]